MFIAGVVEQCRAVRNANGLGQVCEAAQVAAADVLVGHVMTALQNSLVHAKNAAFRRVETDVDKICPESVDFRIAHCVESPPARQRRLDRETHPGAEVVLNPADDFASAGNGGVARIGRAQPARNRVGVEQIFASREIQSAGKCALAGSIRSGDDGQDRQLSGSRAR